MIWQETIPGEIYFLSIETEPEWSFIKYTVNARSGDLIDVYLAGPRQLERVNGVPIQTDIFEDIKIRRVTRIELAKAKLYGL